MTIAAVASGRSMLTGGNQLEDAHPEDQDWEGGRFGHGEEGEADWIGKQGGHNGKGAEVFATGGVPPDVSAGLVGDVKIAARIKRQREWVSKSGAGKNAERDSIGGESLHGVAELIGDVKIAGRVKCQATRVEINSCGEMCSLASVRRKAEDSRVGADVWRADKDVVVGIHCQGDGIQQSRDNVRQQCAGRGINIEGTVAVVADHESTAAGKGHPGRPIQSCGGKEAEIRPITRIALDGVVSVIGHVEVPVSIKGQPNRTATEICEGKVSQVRAPGRKP